VLDPRSTYQSIDEWQLKAQKLANLFVENFARYTDNEQGRSLVGAGPVL
jgi:phosphoenolpyruvate carboxykinase (ATP)